MIRLRKRVLHLSTILFVHSCGNGTEAGPQPMVRVVFSNESRFTVEALLLHEEPMNYAGKPNLLMEPLQPGQSLTHDIPENQWYVTVYRQPNQDSEVLAYTTATAWNAAAYPKIIYFDEQFRVSMFP